MNLISLPPRSWKPTKRHRLFARRLYLAAWFLLPLIRLQAQSVPAPAAVTTQLVDVSQWVLPALDTVLEMARANSPNVKVQKAMASRSQTFIKNQKQLWLDGLGVDMQLANGNQALLVQQPTGNLDAFQNYNNGYRASLNLRLSLYSILGRKNVIRMAEAEAEAAQQRVNYSTQETEAVVINKYYAVQAAQALLRIKDDSKQINRLSRQMAEKDFSQGNISIIELARIVQISNFSDAEFETARQNFYENLRMLELLTGHELFPKN